MRDYSDIERMTIHREQPLQATSSEAVAAFLERFRQAAFTLTETPSSAAEPPSATPVTAEPPGVDRIAAFLQRFREATRRAPAPKPAPAVAEVEGFLAEFTKAFEADLEQQAVKAPRLNLWAAMGLGHYEVRNCRVLAWLLNSSATHSQGARFLCCLLLHQPSNEAGSGYCPEEKADQRYKVRREEQLSEDSRVDITITGSDFQLLIEAKIDAELGGGQLERYWEARDRTKQVFGLYLTPGGVAPPEGSPFRPISWTNVEQALRCFAGQTGSTDDRYVARNDFVRLLAKQYADFILAEWEGT